MKLAGIILIALGILAMVYQGFTYTQTKEVAKVGPVEITDKEKHDVPIPPIIGGVLIVAGVGALAASGRSSI